MGLVWLRSITKLTNYVVLPSIRVRCLLCIVQKCLSVTDIASCERGLFCVRYMSVRVGWTRASNTLRPRTHLQATSLPHMLLLYLAMIFNQMYPSVMPCLFFRRQIAVCLYCGLFTPSTFSVRVFMREAWPGQQSCPPSRSCKGIDRS